MITDKSPIHFTNSELIIFSIADKRADKLSELANPGDDDDDSDSDDDDDDGVVVDDDDVC